MIDTNRTKDKMNVRQNSMENKKTSILSQREIKKSKEIKFEHSIEKDSLETDQISGTDIDESSDHERTICSQISIQHSTRISTRIVSQDVMNPSKSKCNNQLNRSTSNPPVSSSSSKSISLNQSVGLTNFQLEGKIQKLIKDLAVNLCIKIKSQLNEVNQDRDQPQKIFISTSPTKEQFGKNRSEFTSTTSNENIEEKNKDEASEEEENDDTSTLKSTNLNLNLQQINLKLKNFSSDSSTTICQSFSTESKHQNIPILTKSIESAEQRNSSLKIEQNAGSASSSISYKMLPEVIQKTLAQKKESELIDKIKDVLTPYSIETNGGNVLNESISTFSVKNTKKKDFKDQSIQTEPVALLDEASHKEAEFDLNVEQFESDDSLISTCTDSSVILTPLTDFSTSIDSLSSISMVSSDIDSRSTLTEPTYPPDQADRQQSNLNKKHECRYMKSFRNLSEPVLQTFVKKSPMSIDLKANQIWNHLLPNCDDQFKIDLRNRIRQQVEIAANQALLSCSTSNKSSRYNQIEK